jgi:flagellar assembly factor FliW
MTASSVETMNANATEPLVTEFGTFEVGEREKVSFPSGLPGFEACRKFVLLSSPELGVFQCLRSCEGPAASFVVVDPRRVLPTYRTVLSQADLVRLGTTNEAAAAPLLWLAIVTLEDATGQAHVNLRAPIVINPQMMVGYQLMPSNSLYPLRHPLSGD